jgi:hypothetical protein
MVALPLFQNLQQESILFIFFLYHESVNQTIKIKTYTIKKLKKKEKLNKNAIGDR